jgi:hypothetical protein
MEKAGVHAGIIPVPYAGTQPSFTIHCEKGLLTAIIEVGLQLFNQFGADFLKSE